MTIRVAEAMATDVYFVYVIEHMFSIIYTYIKRSEQDISTEIKHEITRVRFSVRHSKEHNLCYSINKLNSKFFSVLEMCY